MTIADDVVFLFGVDNTFLDNDRVQYDLRAHLEREFGPGNRDRYWQIFEALRRELGYADYRCALQRYQLGAMKGAALRHLGRRLRQAARARGNAAALSGGDDKPLLLAAMKQVLGARLTTIFVRQGHYALESTGTTIDPPPDLGIERIGELKGMDMSHFLSVAPVCTPVPAPDYPQEQI